MLNMDNMPVQQNPPDPKAIKMLQEKGYAAHDVQRIAAQLAKDQQWSPQHPEMHEAIFKRFVRHYIVPTVASALLNEAKRQESKPNEH